MTNNGDPASPPSSDKPTLPLLLVAGIAVLAGTIARFKGLGHWPLAWDEYYLAQSIQNVLHSGLPQYPCGGFYARGVLVQYLAALLQLAGLSAQLAPRLIAAISSLIALAATYRIARRCAGTDIALLAVTILALSVWEVEIARFGRMYAPFQALFLWYVVFFLEYTLDRRVKALVPMLSLSVVGVLVWEGGALLALTNFLPPFINRTPGRLVPAGCRRSVRAGVLVRNHGSACPRLCTASRISGASRCASVTVGGCPAPLALTDPTPWLAGRGAPAPGCCAVRATLAAALS
jgi:hypothetical protein